MFELWHRVAIFSALAARGWHQLPPEPLGRYEAGESHVFVREDETLVLRAGAAAGMIRLWRPGAGEVVATVEPGHRTYRLVLQPRDGARWQAALHEWADRVSGTAPAT
ncbi:MAG: hypothetical protein IRY91_03330 [Gemmatimonadaceae bacterium]|nr:hypothetical protein [Gemmatimonadaceae bacterium]